MNISKFNSDQLTYRWMLYQQEIGSRILFNSMTALEFFLQLRSYIHPFTEITGSEYHISLCFKKNNTNIFSDGLLYYSEKNFLMMNDAQIIFLSDDPLEEKSIYMKTWRRPSQNTYEKVFLWWFHFTYSFLMNISLNINTLIGFILNHLHNLVLSPSLRHIAYNTSKQDRAKWAVWITVSFQKTHQ